MVGVILMTNGARRRVARFPVGAGADDPGSHRVPLAALVNVLAPVRFHDQARAPAEVVNVAGLVVLGGNAVIGVDSHVCE
jgi:hypothetical protein